MRIWNFSLSIKLEKDPSRGGEFIKLNDTEKFTLTGPLVWSRT